MAGFKNIAKQFFGHPAGAKAWVFKGFASITRIVDLPVNKEYLHRSPHETDRRRFKLSITKSGLKIIDSLKPIARSCRKTALNGIPAEDIRQFKTTLNSKI